MTCPRGSARKAAMDSTRNRESCGRNRLAPYAWSRVTMAVKGESMVDVWWLSRRCGWRTAGGTHEKEEREQRQKQAHSSSVYTETCFVHCGEGKMRVGNATGRIIETTGSCCTAWAPSDAYKGGRPGGPLGSAGQAPRACLCTSGNADSGRKNARLIAQSHLVARKPAIFMT